jgi:glycosyltransferase involved in cell wall biosynthesis
VPAKLLELDLTKKIMPVWGTEKHDRIYILVRYDREPIGWLSVSNIRKYPVISAERLRDAIKERLSWPLAQAMLRAENRINGAPEDTLAPISVVVCTRDRTDLLSGCLRALQALDYPRYEVIVVDNAPSNNETAQLVASLPVRYIREERPGLDWARNRGIAEARHSIIAFTDDDARPDYNWLRAIGSAFLDSEVMAVTGLVAPAELETAAQQVFEFGYGGMGKGFRRRMFRLRDITQRELLWAHMFGVGANMAFRRELFAVIGSFDVALDVGTPSGSGGDLDMLHRVVAKGHALVYEPAALVWHIHRRSSSVLRRQLFDNGRGFGSYLFTCLRNGNVSRISILYFAMWDWLGWWLLRRLVRPRGFSRRMIMAELLGALRSPIAYMAAQVHARKIATSFGTAPMQRITHISVPSDPKPEAEECISNTWTEAPVCVGSFSTGLVQSLQVIENNGTLANPGGSGGLVFEPHEEIQEGHIRFLDLKP